MNLDLESQSPEWFIECPGMSDASMWSFEADGRWFLYHVTPGSFFAVFSLPGQEPASLEDVVLLANAIAFDHDMPIGLKPARGNPAHSQPLVLPAFPDPGPEPGEWYWEQLSGAMDLSAEMRLGMATVQLRYDLDHPELPQFSGRFTGLTERLGLYAMAARQVDPLSEYACLWRVIESADGQNGTRFASSGLDLLADFDFGECDLTEWVFQGPRRTANLFEIYRDRALRQVRLLGSSGMSNADIAAHLYARRNAISHGRFSALTHDSDDSILQVGADLPIVKLLARIAMVPNGIWTSRETDFSAIEPRPGAGGEPTRQ